MLRNYLAGEFRNNPSTLNEVSMFSKQVRRTKLAIISNHFETQMILAHCFQLTAMDPKTIPVFANKAEVNSVAPPWRSCSDLLRQLCPLYYGLDENKYAACAFSWSAVGSTRADQSVKVEQWAGASAVNQDGVTLHICDLQDDLFAMLGVNWNTLRHFAVVFENHTPSIINNDNGIYTKYEDENGLVVIVVRADARCFGPEALKYINPMRVTKHSENDVSPAFRSSSDRRFLTIPGVLRVCYLSWMKRSRGEEMEATSLQLCRNTMSRVCFDEIGTREALCRYVVQEVLKKASGCASFSAKQRFIRRPDEYDSIQ